MYVSVARQVRPKKQATNKSVRCVPQHDKLQPFSFRSLSFWFLALQVVRRVGSCAPAWCQRIYIYMDSALETSRADYLVSAGVCETLAASQPSSDAERTCVLDMLITVAHDPDVLPEQRQVLYRLADLFHLCWSNTWDSLETVNGPSEDRLFSVRCYVPPKCPMVWEGMVAQAEVNACMCGVAATLVRVVQANLSAGGYLDRTRHWIDIAQSRLTVTGQMLRKAEQPLREAEMA